MKYKLEDLIVKARPDWSPEDFVTEVLKREDWEEYESQYPNLLWGTHIYEYKGEEILVCRFSSRVKCRQYCTGPTLCDEGVGL